MAHDPSHESTEITASRYRLLSEIGRGGLGRVVEARDAVLKRDVAVKLVLDDLPPELRDRFVREAELTARLEHPNVVPVHDFGVMRDEHGERQLFLCMKRVRGRDLGQVLRGLARGEPKDAAHWSRARLLRVFQDICLGVAYAHAQGVLHRDLKPANVMIGDFGEVLIVDWGLAKDLSAVGEVADEERVASPSSAPGSPLLTMEGAVLGTPAYMPPEQADGRLADMDERSDVYSLGAILFELLALRPPVEGNSLDEVITKVKCGALRAPSTVQRPAHVAAASPIPPELDAIVMKALARAQADRYAGALEFHDEVQLFLEGVKERERRSREAAERSAAGGRERERARELETRIEEAEKGLKRLGQAVKKHAALEEKKPLWEAEDELERLRESRIEALARAEAEYGQALVVDTACVEAVDGRCEMVIERYLAAEAKRDRQEMFLQRKTLEGLDRGGRHLARLDAPGTLELRAFAFECNCNCLAPVKDGEWGLAEHEAVVPWRDGSPRPDLRLEDQDYAVPRLSANAPGARFGHAADCPRREVRGASVEVARCEERGRRLVPVPGAATGATPFGPVALPQGSYLATIRAEGFADDVLLPVRIDRAGAWSQEVNLYRRVEIPRGFRYVPGGPYIGGGLYTDGGEEATILTRDLFVDERAVTAGEYIEYLNELCLTGREEEALRRQPREGERRFLKFAGGEFQSGEEAPLTSKEFPVIGVSWDDALAWLAWKSKRDGRPWRLMNTFEGEKATRGVDGRIYPWGDRYDATFSNTNGSHPDSPRPVPAGSREVDSSPYGIRDLAGNAQTWCLDAPFSPFRAFRCLRGGAWCNNEFDARAAIRKASMPGTPNAFGGFRACLAPWRWPY
ncbi:MAG: SUMF1/EgtB/PvdO family nonheme iron enzyme [Planctomycetes bacterium]|nr:SUMF1/EgtB/PvdO family nonheme iron enzyme [Planctomycetota bacterium]